MPAAGQELLYEFAKTACCCVTIIVKMPLDCSDVGLAHSSTRIDRHRRGRELRGAVGIPIRRNRVGGSADEPFLPRSTPAALSSRTQARTIPGDGRVDLDRRGAPRKCGGAIISPRVCHALLAAAALSNNRAAALLRCAAALRGSRGASCAGLWSAHVAGMVPRQFQGDDQWQLSAL